MGIPFIDLQSQYQAYKDEINQKIQNVLDSSSYIMGSEIAELEKNLASYTGSKNAIACSSGTDALLLTLMAIDIKPNDEVITTPFTFIATAEVVALLGAKPIFVDIEPDTYNIDASKIEQKITPKTKAIIPVSLFGQTSDMDEINKIAKRHNIVVIEDAAQSFGASYKGKKSCNISHLACTSFFPAKPLGCYGDGGAIFTNDDELATKIRMLLNHGQSQKYKHKYIGINGRLDTIQAAVLNVKLKYFDTEVAKRLEVAKRYETQIKGDFVLPTVKSDRVSVYAQYCIRSKKRDEVIKKLTQKGIPTAIYYPIPLHLQECFNYLGYKEGDFPISEATSKEIFAIPFSPFLKESDQELIIEALNNA